MKARTFLSRLFANSSTSGGAVNLPVLNIYRAFLLPFNSVRFLTALRIGELGSEYLNQAIAERLRQVDVGEFSAQSRQLLGKTRDDYANDSNIRLSNGDVGLLYYRTRGR